MSRLKVLYMPHPNKDVKTPWGDDVMAAIGHDHDVRVYDRGRLAAEQFEGIEAIVDLGGNITLEEIAIAKAAGVGFFQAQTNGLDDVEVDAILNTGMAMAHCPGPLSSVALAQSAMMFILMLAHRYGKCQEALAQSRYFWPPGMDLVGQTLGIIGLGASGVELARRAKPFGMRLVAVDVRPIDPEVLDEIQPDMVGSPEDLDQLVSESDFISMHLPLIQATRHTIDERRIGLMKPTACLVNVARGELVDEEALYQALLEGRIGGAGLDAFAQEPLDITRPVYQLVNVLVTPHIAGATDGTSRNRAQFAADNLKRIASGQEPLGKVEKHSPVDSAR